MHNPYDKNIKEPILVNGSTIRFYDDKEVKGNTAERLLFLGRVTKSEKNSEIGSITYTAKDYMDNLLNSKITKKWSNKTPEFIAKSAAGMVGVHTGSIINTKMKMPKLFASDDTVYNVILRAYYSAHKKNGKKYFMRMNGTKLDIIEKGKIIDNFMLNQASSIISSNYTEDNDGIVDRVAIYNKSHKKIGQISNASWVKQYGVYQATLTAKSGGKAKAKKMLKSKTREAEINGIGDNRCVAGCGIWILDKSTGLKGKFWIESDSHTCS